MSILRSAAKGAARPAVRAGIAVTAVAAAVLIPSAASAAPPPVTASTAGVVYDNVPHPTPGNLVSEAFEAQSASEFGSPIHMTVLSVANPVVTVVMSSWGCQSGNWFANNCVTTPGATFSEPITLNIYAAGATTIGAPPGALLKTVTQTFNIPFRPSADPTHCTGTNAGKWFSAADSTCYNGFATPIVFHVVGTVPSNVVVSLAYNTTHYGYAPIGESAPCFTSPGGCGYDSLNVGLSGPPSVGTNPAPGVAYVNSSWSGAYCTPTTVGSFVRDGSCWTNFQPAITIQSGAVHTLLHANPSIAKVLPGLKIYLTLSARLTTAAGNPVAGEPISFSAVGQHVCTAFTNLNGTAACSGLLNGVLKSVIGLGYTASFAGHGVLLPSSSHGSLVQVL
jgi:hypothetical protein